MPSKAAQILPFLLLCGALASPWAARGDDAHPMLLETAASSALLDSARTHLLAYRMEEAEALLRRLVRRSDGRPAALYHLTLAALHRALMSDEAAHFEVFHARSDSLVVELATAPATPWRDNMRADRDLWEAVAFLKQGRYLRAAWSGRSAYRTYERIVAAFPDFYDAYTGLGLLHLTIASMPRSYRFVLDVLGYEGGIARGIGELQTAHRRARYASFEAALLLALTHEMLSLDEEEGLRVAAALRDEYPESTFVAHVYAFLLIANRQVDEATAILLEAIRRSETERYFYNHYLDFYLAEALFRADQYAEAARYYRRYLDRHGGPALKALAYLGLGKALEMQHRRTEAVAAFEQVRAARTFDTDEAAKREAEHFLTGPLSPRDRTLLRATNAFDSNRLDEALTMLADLREGGGLTSDQAAEVAYRLGRVHYARGEYVAAVAEFERAASLGGDPLSRWAPWSLFYVGKIRVEQGRREEAQAAFDRALAYPGKYDYYQALEQSVRAALEFMGG